MIQIDLHGFEIVDFNEVCQSDYFRASCPDLDDVIMFDACALRSDADKQVRDGELRLSRLFQRRARNNG